MPENPTYNVPLEEEEEGLDLIGLVKRMWDGRKTIIIWTVVFMVLGLVSALTMKRIYTVSAVVVPQVNSKSNSSLNSLAAMAGLDIGSNMSASELSPLVYPQIVNSVPFRLELVNTPLHYKGLDEPVSMLTYATEYSKPGVKYYILKYTIGLPGVIMEALSGNKKEEQIMPSTFGDTEDGIKPVQLTKDEAKMVKAVGENVNLAVDKKEGYLTLSVTGSEPIQTTELGTKALELLQEEITRFRTDKVKSELEYIQARYDEVKKETESLQAALAALTDRSQDMPSSRSKMERERLQTKYNVSNTVYMELAKQLEQAKLQVKKETPVFAILQPITVPTRPANSRARTLIVWTFMGFIIGCGIVFCKGAWPGIKEKFQKKEEEGD